VYLLDIYNESSMKTVALLLSACAGLLAQNLSAADVPRGNLLELHSCELYAGGCVVSSEATLGGRYLLRAWQFTGGSFAGSELTGLQVALVQSSADNLASPKADPGQAVVYLPANATSSQRDALLAWIRATEPKLKGVDLHSRTVPLQFTKSETGYAFSAGDFVFVKTASRESCETGACGDALWYSPRSGTSVFTVAIDRSSQVVEPLLQLKWTDAGKRSVFLARFGEKTGASDVFVASADLCGPTGKLF
jgi:hypothetical protein